MTTIPTDSALGRAVLATDELLRDPRCADLADTLRDLAPPGLLDQLDAAADHSRHALRVLADQLGVDVDHRSYDAHPAWVTLGLLDTVTAWHTGRGRTCLHDPHPNRPSPVLATAWRPRLVTCAACACLHTLPRGSAGDRTCDGCGTVTPGVQHGAGIYPATLNLGPLTYLLGVCGDCRWWA